jgi:hypothetical protein
VGWITLRIIIKNNNNNGGEDSDDEMIEITKNLNILWCAKWSPGRGYVPTTAAPTEIPTGTPTVAPTPSTTDCGIQVPGTGLLGTRTIPSHTVD